MWAALGAGILAAGAGCLLRSEYEKSHFAAEELIIASPKIQREKCLVFLTDVHDKEFGPANEKLLKAIADSQPDGILIGGDLMVAKGEGSLEASFRLLEGLAPLAPIYYSLGNHEMRLRQEQEVYGEAYQRLLKKADQLGVRMLLDDRAVFDEDTEIWGADLPRRFYKKLLFQKPEMMEPGYLHRKLGEASLNRYTILLMHSPLYFEAAREWGADLTLSGHFHGGTIRIPGLGGVMTPQYQFFLPWCAGVFEEEGKLMAVGRGLGTHSINIRLNGRPQLLVIRLRPGELHWKMAGKRK